MIVDLIPELMEAPQTCRHLNQILRSAGIKTVFFRSMKRTSMEPRKTYEVCVYSSKDHEFKHIYHSSSLRACINALKFY